MASPAPVRESSVPVAGRQAAGGLLGAGAIIGTGLAVELGAQFARTILLARLLGATEFGLVVSINTLFAAVELFGFIGLDRYLIYAPDGGGKRALAAVHAVTWLRGISLAALVVLLAWPAAALVGEEAHWESFALVGIVPLLRGTVHMGNAQQQRQGRFWPLTVADTTGAMLGLVASGIAAFYHPDHRAILWGLGVQVGSAALLTHLMAPVPYRIAFDRPQVRAILRYGLPLVGNGLALAVASQLDRMVVGAWLGVATLGVYGLSLTLLVQPLSLLLRLGTTALQPRLSSAWHADPHGAFPHLVAQIGRWCALLGCAGSVATALLGAPALQLIFGRAYAVPDAFFIVMAGVVLLRLSRGLLNLIGLGIGRNGDLMVANIAASASLPATIVAFWLGAGLVGAAGGLLAGELIGFVVAHLRLRRYSRAGLDAILPSLAAAAVVPALAGAWVASAQPGLTVRIGIGVVVLLMLTPLLRGMRSAVRG